MYRNFVQVHWGSSDGCLDLEWEFRKEFHPLQEGGSNCGPFSLKVRTSYIMSCISKNNTIFSPKLSHAYISQAAERWLQGQDFDFPTTTNHGDLYRKQFGNLLLAVNSKVRLPANVYHVIALFVFFFNTHDQGQR